MPKWVSEIYISLYSKYLNRFFKVADVNFDNKELLRAALTKLVKAKWCQRIDRGVYSLRTPEEIIHSLSYINKLKQLNLDKVSIIVIGSVGDIHATRWSDLDVLLIIEDPRIEKAVKDEILRNFNKVQIVVVNFEDLVKKSRTDLKIISSLRRGISITINSKIKKFLEKKEKIENNKNFYLKLASKIIHENNLTGKDICYALYYVSLGVLLHVGKVPPVSLKGTYLEAMYYVNPRKPEFWNIYDEFSCLKRDLVGSFYKRIKNQALTFIREAITLVKRGKTNSG